VEEFLRRDLNVNKQSLEGWTGLQLAVTKNQIEIIRVLLKEVTLDINIISPK